MADRHGCTAPQRGGDPVHRRRPSPLPDRRGRPLRGPARHLQGVRNGRGGSRDDPDLSRPKLDHLGAAPSCALRGRGADATDQRDAPQRSCLGAGNPVQRDERSPPDGGGGAGGHSSGDGDRFSARPAAPERQVVSEPTLQSRAVPSGAERHAGADPEAGRRNPASRPADHTIDALRQSNLRAGWRGHIDPGPAPAG